MGWTTLQRGPKQRYSSKTVETEASREPAIRQELERVLSSPGFARNERLSQFLRFLVDRHLEGRDSELKESVIALEVFGRKAGYDPKLDAIVRTEAVRLRARLEKYYQTGGSQDPLIIDLPKGGYRPVVRERVTAADETVTPTVPPAMKARAGSSWWIAAALAVLVLVAIGTVWWGTRPSRESFTIAVLPFENLGGDPANDYFADGLTDEIIRNLSVIDGLTVPSRTSSFALKGKGFNAGEAGKQLGADYLVEGSVLHSGDQLRVIVALVRARDEFRLWSDRFDRRLTDVFAIHDEISHGIVNTLRLSFSPGRRRYETNLEAYDLYLRGRHIMASFPARGRPIAMPAVGYFEQAISQRPQLRHRVRRNGRCVHRHRTEHRGGESARRHDLAASQGCCGTSGRSSTRCSPKPRRGRLDSCTRIRLAGSGARVPSRDRAQPEQCARPSGARGLRSRRAGTLSTKASQEIRRAVALDPLSPYVNTEVGAALTLGGPVCEAVDQLRKASRTGSQVGTDLTTCSAARSTLQGKHAEALGGMSTRASNRGSGQTGVAGLCQVRCRTTRRGARSSSRATQGCPRRSPESGRDLRVPRAMRSTRSSISRKRWLKTNQVLPRSSRRRSWPRCARTRVSRRCARR